LIIGSVTKIKKEGKERGGGGDLKNNILVQRTPFYQGISAGW